MRFPVVGIVLAAFVALVGCDKLELPTSGGGGGSGDVKVADVVLGRALAPDGSIVAEAKTNSFWATDTFYVSVALEGTGDNVPLVAKWTDASGAVVSESSKTASPRGSTYVAFEAPPPQGARWTEGDYTVEIVMNGQSQGVKELHAR
jgi:flagellar hook assembly protein FlgD